MAPVAVHQLTPRHSFSDSKPSPTPPSDRAREIPRRPSPWHDLAHSLSELPSPAGVRRLSSPGAASPLAYPIPGSVPSPSPGAPNPLSLDHDSPSLPPLSTSQAMRDWERSAEFRRHQLIHTPPRGLSARNSSVSLSGGRATPKLEPERDKDGHIEYKLKLIDPSPDRFERLVTQMLWRLKQGRNEAIYEIGLADDGAVIGLTRSEMDASLKTLELMASEVGATVIVLKEILLSGPRPMMRAFSTSGMSSSSVRSRSGSSATSVSDDANSRGAVEATPKSKKYKKKNQMAERRERTESSSSRASSASQGGSPVPRKLSHKPSFDDSVPFQLDMDDVHFTPKSAGKLRTSTPSEAHVEQSRKYSAKAARSAQRKEQRRLDLIRGDGTNPIWVEMSAGLDSPAPPLPPSAAPIAKALPVSTLPAQPSSLRLASTTSSPDDQFLADLWRLPLDNLSLSFANVCKVVNPIAGGASIPSSHSTDTEYAAPLDAESTDDETDRPTTDQEEDENTTPEYSGLPTSISGEERICVEALIVRKSGGGGWCGGEDDGWGFGEEEDEEELAELPPLS